MKSILFYLSVFCFLFFSCIKGKDDCGKPRQDNNPEVFINMVGTGEFCPEVSEGFTLFLDWSYITGDDAGNRKFAFEGTEGFDVLTGSVSGSESSKITLVARKDSPAEATIEVYAYNDCGESNRGIAKVKVRKDPPYVFEPRLDLPTRITQAATFTYDGKGYVIGGLRGNLPNGYTNWVYDPTDNSLEELSPSVIGSPQSAAVIGDTAYLVGNGGRYIQVYHIPTNAMVRFMDFPNMEQDPFYHIVSAFAVGNKIYIGPIAPFANIKSYNIVTGEFKNETAMTQMAGVPGKSAFYLDNRIYYFYDSGPGFVYNPTLNTLNTFTTPFEGFNNVVTSYVVNGKAYVVASDGHYTFNPTDNTFTKIEIFNGNNCFALGWSGFDWYTSNFVIGDRVYYVGGQDDKMGGGKDYFFGARF
ncbi:MAG: hypothetical protein R2825_21760 [Saprospiraceae bacterium]